MVVVHYMDINARSSQPNGRKILTKIIINKFSMFSECSVVKGNND
jgi:hypothetical protein